MFFESFWLNFIVALILIIALTFDYVTKFFSYWYVRHIPYKTAIPFYGSDYHRVLGLKSNTDEVNSLYHQHPKEDFVGCVKGRTPDLIVRNPDIVKEVLSTEFESFQSRGLDLDKSQDICLRNNLFYAEGEKWTLLRGGLDTLSNEANVVEEGLLECLSGTNGNTNVQLLLASVLDVVFQKLLLKDSDGALLREIRQALQKRTLLDKLKFYLKNIFPSVYTFFGLSTVAQPSSITLKSLHDSQLNKKIGSMFQFGNKDKFNKFKTKSHDLTYGIVSTFISEGYIPCLNAISALLFEVAKNRQFQQKARYSEEYLEAVVKETLRLHSPYSIITRKCVKTFKFADSKMLVDRGVTVNIPIDAIHKDSTYYKEPEAFNPERFLDNLAHSYAFLPFGAGPRKCIGDQLGLQIIKTVSRIIIKNFDLEPVEDSSSKITLVDHNFARIIDTNVLLKFKPVCC